MSEPPAVVDALVVTPMRRRHLTGVLAIEAQVYPRPWSARLFEDELERQDARIETFLGKKGDVLVWHACLLHRGSPPRGPGSQRLSFISHYHGLSHWAMGPRVGHHPNGTMYFLNDEPCLD